MKSYLDLVRRVLESGRDTVNRTQQTTLSITGAMIEHDLSEGFPLLTVKKVAYKSAFSEMLLFLRGEHDIREFQHWGCTVWNADHARWHGPQLQEDKKRLASGAADSYEAKLLSESIDYREENPFSLGKIYGCQWRNFNGVDQAGNVFDAICNHSNSRRLLISGWNPSEMHLMSLPPCHVSYHFIVRGDYLDVTCSQRSCDVPLGLPYNLANLGLLAHVFSHCSGLLPGKIVWQGSDVHIYHNQIPAMEEILKRELKPLPNMLLSEQSRTCKPWELILEDIIMLNYEPHGRVSIPLTVS